MTRRPRRPLVEGLHQGHGDPVPHLHLTATDPPTWPVGPQKLIYFGNPLVLKLCGVTTIKAGCRRMATKARAKPSCRCPWAPPGPKVPGRHRRRRFLLVIPELAKGIESQPGSGSAGGPPPGTALPLPLSIPIGCRVNPGG